MTPDMLPPRFAAKIRTEGDCWLLRVCRECRRKADSRRARSKAAS